MTSDGVKKVLAALWRAFVTALWVLRGALRAFWSVARAPVFFALNILAALIVLFEEWGWKPLSEMLARLARFAPIAAVERWIATLPPYAALLVFALPTTILLPLKFLAMWLLAGGQYALATALFIGAKIASTALVARIFMLTRPALMQLAWFARAYNWFVPWKDHLFGLIRASWVWRYGRMVKNRIKLEVKQAWTRLKPRALPYLKRLPGFSRLLRPDGSDIRQISGQQRQAFEAGDPSARRRE